MSLNSQTWSERLHIGFFGLRNAGKSSVVNAVTGQNLSVVSQIKGTTTDPVKKSMELLPIGPVVVIDTPGIDDEGTLGELRVKRALRILDETNVAVLVVDGSRGLANADRELIGLFRKKNIPYIVAFNKSDLGACLLPEKDRMIVKDHIRVSALTGEYIHELKELIGRVGKTQESGKKLVADLIEPGDLVVLVTPIDAAAPKGRMILPQQQMIRDVLDAGAINIVTKETELAQALESLNKKPKMVITDSQAFGKVSRETPNDILLTSFSILFARYKGNLKTLVQGAAALDQLKDHDRILISEGCTHHRQCGDIGTQKLPAWIKQYTGKTFEYTFTSGNEFPENLSDYALVIHCGGCMLNEREMQSRISHCEEAGVMITNYGTAIAKMHGILKRSLEPFPEIAKLV